jgi:2-oxoglutarate ferredoxin oxidoreductase subunit beta
LFYQVDRPTKNALEQKWIDASQAQVNGASGKDLLKKRLLQMH